MGNAYFQQGRLAESLKAYQVVKKMSPDYLGVYVSIAEIYYKQHLYDDAIRECSIALELMPDFDEARTIVKRIQDDREKHGE